MLNLEFKGGDWRSLETEIPMVWGRISISEKRFEKEGGHSANFNLTGLGQA
jgi:hypothetical protein